MNSALTFLIVDDHPFYLKGICEALKPRSYVASIELAACAHDGKESVRHKCPDIILMDISMEQVNGIACTKLIKERWPNVKVIGMFRYDEVSLVNQIVRAGAIGAINKTLQPKKFLDQLENLIGFRHIHSEQLAKPIEHGLRKRELEIIQLLGKAMSSKEIASILYISKSTVDNHRKRILKKTGLPNTAGVINWAMKNGVITNDDY